MRALKDAHNISLNKYKDIFISITFGEKQILDEDFKCAYVEEKTLSFQQSQPTLLRRRLCLSNKAAR